jgi:hypothetical protein
MMWQDFDGNSHKINLGAYTYRNDGVKRSSLMMAAITLLKKLYPGDPICVEIRLPGASTNLYLDIYLPIRRLAIEVQGAQHFRANTFMHGKDRETRERNFRRGQNRDREKQQLLAHNNITLIYLNDGEESSWESSIRNAFSNE